MKKAEKHEPNQFPFSLVAAENLDDHAAPLLCILCQHLEWLRF